jgi:hypothetical protein
MDSPLPSSSSSAIPANEPSSLANNVMPEGPSVGLQPNSFTVELARFAAFDDFARRGMRPSGCEAARKHGSPGKCMQCATVAHHSRSARGSGAWYSASSRLAVLSSVAPMTKQ